MNPETGELYKPEDLNVFNWNDFRSSDAPGRDLRPRGVAQASPATATSPSASSGRRSRAGCTAGTTRDECVQYALDAGSQLGAGHQAWQMNEVNALVWPSAGGVGVLDPIGWNQTVQVAKGAGIIKQDPSTTAYDTSIVAEALDGHRRRHEG